MQEIQHDAVELLRLLHMRVVSRPGNDNLLRTSDALLQYAGGLNDLWHILIANLERNWDAARRAG